MPGVIIEPDDICLYITEKCNSNCIMCPMSLHSRQRGLSLEDDEWNNILTSLPGNTKHITITGGEPLLEYNRIIPLMKGINTKCPESEVLVLTNGRVLAVDKVFERVHSCITEKYRFAIPLHASNADLHDRITQSPGSFQQTILGLRRLKQTMAKIEIRIVGHRLNQQNINSLFAMIVQMGLKPDVINLIAMEMTGCAGRCRDALWVDYNSLAENAREGILYAISSGIDVGLYNFPLCTIPEGMWPLAKSSITASKVRYDQACEECCVRNVCGGMFYSTYELGLCKVNPIRRQ